MLQNDPLMLLPLHFDADAEPDPAFHFDPSPDPAFQFDADPDPASQNYVDPDLQHWQNPELVISDPDIQIHIF